MEPAQSHHFLCPETASRSARQQASTAGWSCEPGKKTTTLERSTTEIKLLQLIVEF